MSRFCFVLWAGGGNVTATLPIVTRLTERGHETAVLGDVSLSADVAPPVTFHPFRRVPVNDGRDPAADAIRDWQGRTPVGGMVRGYRWLFGDALHVAEDLVEHLQEVPADVVVVDTMLPGGLMAAEAAGVRCASLVHSAWPYPVPGALPVFMGVRPGRGRVGRLRDRVLNAGYRRMFDLTTRALNRERVRLGLPPVKSALEQFLRADSMLVLTSPTFDFVPDGLPPHARYVGPPMPRPRTTDTWEPPPGPEPLVLVALSTTFQDQTALLIRLGEALGRLPVRGLITSTVIDPSAVPVPGNVAVVRQVPHVEVLPHASAVVTHAGHGTTIAALAAGVPVLCLPHGRDQLAVAARAVASGGGLQLSRRASVDQLTNAIRTLLDVPSYADAARHLGDAIRREGNGAERAADELEKLL